MEIFRPLQLGCQQRTIEQDRAFHWIVSATMGIRMSTNEPLLEMDFMKEAIEAMGTSPMPDMGMPKPKGEFLLNGHFYSPTGEPVNGGDVSVKVGNLTKTIRVMGPRQWTSIGSTAQQPITKHWLDYSDAYGGSQYPYNPSGKGFQTDDMPCQEYPNQLVTSKTAQIPPASFGPQDMTWPQRSQFQGTYNSDYMRLYFPGFPKDTDWQFFMCGANDQWNHDHWNGNEPYELHNLHSDHSIIRGNLPDYRVRCFIQDETQSTASANELLLKLDTIWFLPDTDLILLIWRGGKTVQDDEATQIKHVLLGYETANDNRSQEYYQEAIKLRLNSSDALLKSINAFDLVPDNHKSALELFKEKAIDADKPSALSQNIDNKVSEIQNLMNQKLDEGKAEFHRNLAQTDAPQVQGLKNNGLDALVHPKSQSPDPLSQRLEAILPGISSGKIEQLDFSKLTSNTLDRLIAEMKSFSSEKQASLQSTLLEEIKTAKDKLDTMPSTEAAESKASKDAALKQVEQIEKMLQEDKTIGPLPRLDTQALVNSLNAKVEPELRQLKERIRNLKSLGSSQDAIATAQKQLDDLDNFQQNLISDTLTKSEQDFYNTYRLGAEYMDEGLTPHENDDARKQEFLRLMSNGKPVKAQDWACLDLSNLNLDGVDLSDCLLEQVNFSGSSLKNAKFDRAIMTRSNLAGAKFRGASFSETNLGQCECTQADFSHTNFIKATLTRGTFEQTKFEGAQLVECSVLEAKLTDVNFSHASFKKIQFIELQIANSEFKHSQMQDCVFVGCTLKDFDFEQAKLPSTNWINCQFTDGSFEGADLTKNSFVGSDESPLEFIGVLFNQAKLPFSNLQDAKLSHLSFENAVLSNANLSNAQIQHSSFAHAIADKAMLRKANMQHSDWRNANLMESLMTKADMTSADFSGANLYAVDFMRCTMGSTNFRGANLDATLIKDWRPS